VSGRAGDLTNRTIAGLLWTAWGKGGQVLLSLLALVVLARLLTPAEFGTVSAALVLIEFSSIFSRLGLGPAVVQRQHLEPRHLHSAFAGSLALGLLAGVGVWLLAPLAAAFFRNPAVGPVLRALVWVFPLKGISAVAESLMLRELRFRWLANLDVASLAIGNGLVAIPLAAAGWGAWALVASSIVQTLVRSVALVHARRPVLGWPEWRALKEMLHFGGGFTVARLANQLALQGDNLVVGRWLGAAALGLYGRAYGLMAAPAAAVGKVLDDVLFPTMARVQDDPVRLGLAYRRGVAMIALVALPASAVAVVLAPELVLVALGPRWAAVVDPFRILAAGTLFRSSYKMSDSLARSSGVVYRRAWRQVIYAAAVLGGAWVGQHWGVSGVAAGVLGALVVNFLLMAQLGLDVCRLSWATFWDAHRPALLVGAAAGATALGFATIARHTAAPPIVTLVLGSAGAIAVVAALVRCFPQRYLGADGQWTLEAVAAFVSRLSGRARTGGVAADAGPISG
jgi:O-antigen/teichoic acid export membrane protein